MNATMAEWLIFLRSADALVSVPLLAGGGALMVFGWRIWKTCVVLCFVVAGVVVGRELAGHAGDRLLFAAVAAGVSGVLSYRCSEFAVSLLGGLIGTVIAAESLKMIGLTGMAFWLVALALLLSFSAVAYINRQTVVVFVAAFLGAVLVVSGIAVCIMLSPTTYGYFHSALLDSSFVLPFMLLVPTTMSCFYQLSEVNSHGTAV